jgi:hypothetical protein
LQKLDLVYKSNNFYDLPIIGDKLVVIREKGALKLLEWNGAVTIRSLPGEIFSDVTFAQYNAGRVLVLEDRLKTSAMIKSDAENLIRKNQGPPNPVAVSEFSEMPAPTQSFSSTQAENYPRLDHLIPHFWFLATGSSENLTSIGALTTFVDPMEVHTLNATALLYPSVQKVGGTLDYVQKIVRVSDLWYASAYLNQDYSKTDFNSHINLSRDLSFQTFYKLEKKRWTYTTGLYVGKSTTEDFISDRSVVKVGVRNKLDYQSLSYDDFFQYFNGEFNLQSNKANIGNNYLVTQLGSGLGVRFSENFTVSAKGSYEKYYKSDFSRGVIYGGGVSDITKKREHEFYGLPYNNAYGNEMFTTRFVGDYNVHDSYRGKNLFPVFLKETHLLFGRQYLYADRIILDGNILREKMINGIFFGPRFKTTLFYSLPANIDIIYSSIASSDYKNVNQIDFLLTADLF